MLAESKLCLNMIVKNETKTLPNLFKSLHKIIDYYVILDTGSTDGTPELIKEEMNNYNIKGEVHLGEWVNFGYCRNEALKLAVGKADYILIIDADEELYYKDADFFKQLTHNCYNLIKRYGGVEYYIPAILNIKENNKLGWEGKGVVHNYFSTKNRLTDIYDVPVDNTHIISHIHGGAKSHGVSHEEKYLRDAKLLEEELKKNPDDRRSQFYLGQSYRDAGFVDKAIENYQKRADMGGWIEEVYYSKLRIGRLMLQKGKSFNKFCPILLEAYQLIPTRVEAIHTLVNYCRIQKWYHLGYLFGRIPVNIRNTNCKLFIEKYSYDYGLLDDYSICAYWAGDYEEANKCCNIILKEGKIPESQIERIKKNLEFGLEKVNKI